VTKEYVGKGDTMAEQRVNRAKALVARAAASEDARKLKLSTRSSRLALLKRAAEKRKRKGQKRVQTLTQFDPITMTTVGRNALDRES
jgi:hypothetical protein